MAKKNRKEIQEKLDKLRRYKDDLDASIAKSIKDGYAESVLLSGKITDIIDETETTVGEFLNSYEERIKKLGGTVSRASSKSKRMSKDAEESTKKIKDFSKILRHLNKEILDELPEREKIYEEVSQNIEKEKDTFEKTYGTYSKYSKKVQSEIDRVNKEARKTKSLKTLSGLSKQLETMHDLMLDNFKDTAERANVLKQIDRQKAALDKEVEKRSGYINRTFEFLGKNKITIGALAAGITANNPLVMWAVEAFGNIGAERKKDEARQNRFKLDKLLQLRSQYEGEEFLETGGRKLSNRGVGRSRTFGGNSDILKELQIHTKYLKQIASVDEKKFEYQKDTDTEAQRQREDNQAKTEETILESKKEKGKKESGDYRLQEKERFKAAADNTFFENFLGSFLGSGGLGIITSILKKVVIPVAAVAGTVQLASNMMDSREKANKYGTGKLAAGASSAYLPLAGALIGSIFPGIGTFVGFGIGSILQAIIPDDFQKELAGFFQDAIDGIKIFWNRAALAVSWVGDIFSDLGGIIDKMQMKIKFFIPELKSSINNSFGLEIFDTVEMGKERSAWLEGFHKNSIKRGDERRAREKSRMQTHNELIDIDHPTGKEPTALTPAAIPEQNKANFQDDISKLQDEIRVGNPNDPELQKKISTLRTKISMLNSPETNWNQAISSGEITAGKSNVGGGTSSARMPASKMEISDAGLEFIKKKEDFRPAPYWDVDGLAIGYGSHTMPNGQPVRRGDTISRDAANEMLRRDVNSKYTSGIKRNINTDLTQSQFDALASISYNAGPGAIGQNSSLTRMINNGDMSGASEKIKTYYATVQGAPSAVNSQRRLEESNMFSSGSSNNYIAANDQNSTAKLNAATRPAAPIVVANNTAQNRSSAGGGSSAGVNRAAPRGNEPALQSALNTDFSGSSA